MVRQVLDFLSSTYSSIICLSRLKVESPFFKQRLLLSLLNRKEPIALIFKLYCPEFAKGKYVG